MMRKTLLGIMLLVVAMVIPSAAEVLHTQSSPNEEQSGCFGYSVSGVGDVNGDGHDDIAVGALNEAPDGSPNDEGRAYVFSGRSGILLHTLAPPWPAQGARFGTAVSGAGDVNGDGFSDIVVGAFRDTYASQTEDGTAFVFSGQTGDTLLALISPNADNHGYFGSSVTGAGDVNGDGHNDIVVGAPGEILGGFYDSGTVYVFDGYNGMLLYTFISPNPEYMGVFGYSVSLVADVSDDGYPDIVIGAPWEDPDSSPDYAGRAYLFSGSTGNLLGTFRSPNEQQNGRFGISVAGLDDVNGDGNPDIAIGAYRECPGNSPDEAGRAYVFNGRTGDLIHTLISPHEVVTGRFGCSVRDAGDLNGDGLADILVGAYGEETGSSPDDAGRAYVFSGQTGELLCAVSSPNEEFWGYFGYSVSGAGDVNGDGYPEVVIGAHNESPGSSPNWAGRAYVFSWIHLAVELAADELGLQWSTWVPASEYWIYGMANDPWFTPDLSPPTYVNRVAVVQNETTNWSTSNGIGDPDNNWTYLIIAVDHANAELARSHRAGEFDSETVVP